MYLNLVLVFALLPLLASALPQETPEHRQQGGGSVLQNVFQFPQNVINTITGGRSEYRIGQACQYTTDCLEQTQHSVCFNGTCLCNLGYRYQSTADECKPVDPCPICRSDNRCVEGVDVSCNGDCISTFIRMDVGPAKIGVSNEGQMIKSHPEWPLPYAEEQELYYCMKAPSGRRVNLKLLWIDLETQCGSGCDSITIYNGCVARDENIIAFYNGDNADDYECITSYCNEMLIKFKTDKIKNNTSKNELRSGFMGYYSESTYEEDKCSYHGARKTMV